MKSSATVNVNDVYSTLMSYCDEFKQEVDEDITEHIHHAAEISRDSLRKAVGEYSQLVDLPERERLLYEKGWKAYKGKMRDGEVEAVVANATAPGLTHLIENGHELFVYGQDTGRRTIPRPHIAEAYEQGKDYLLGGMG